MNEIDHHSDTQRVEAFSDGVLAIVITLLVLEIGVPHVTGEEKLARALWEEWPSFLAYALSFLTIGITWINHHGMFKDIERIDHTAIVLNLLLLMSLSLLPFSTAVLAEYLKDPDRRVVATLFYGATWTAIAIFFNALWFYASWDHRLIDRHVSERRLQSRTRRYLVGPVAYGLTLPLVLITPLLSIGLYVAYAVFYILPLAEEPAEA